jgi:Protein of unknown function (DUF4230)
MSPRDVDDELKASTRELPEYEKGDHPEGDQRLTGGGSADVAGRRPGRPLFWVLGAIGLVLVMLVANQAIGLFPRFGNPFAEEKTDRSQPPLLQSIQDLSRYVAAEGNFQVVIDVQRNRQNAPDFLVNRRTLFVGAGSVEAYVDFGTIGEGAINESADGKSVSIRLPEPQLAEPNLDLERSYVVAEQKGLLDWVNDVFNNDPNRQQQVYQLAEERIAGAARESGLTDRARENTQKMLEGLLRSLGYTSVTITFAAP